MSSAPPRPALFCAICQSPIASGESVGGCPSCKAPYHYDCWRENRGCAVYGCPCVPKTEKWEDIELPDSHWGREEKPCPACRQTIKASALRCRHCGSVFDSAAPQSQSAFQQRSVERSSLPALRRQAIWIFCLCLIPFLAPFMVVVALWWWAGAKERGLGRLSGLYNALPPIGIATAALITLVTMSAMLVQCSQVPHEPPHPKTVR